MILATIALFIGYESLLRLVNPVSIEFDQAIAIALAGLAVNLVIAWLLRGDDRHGDGHAAHRSHPHVGEPGHPHHHHDHNLRAAFLHVLADALSFVLVIAALLAGRIYGWVRMDALVASSGHLSSPIGPSACCDHRPPSCWTRCRTAALRHK